MPAQKSQNLAAGEAAHTPTPWITRTFEDVRFLPGQARLHGVSIEAHPDFNNGFAIADFFGDDRAANAAFVLRACNSHDALVAALEDARKGLAVARTALKTAHHCMNSGEYSADETKFQNARDLVYTAFVGVSASEDRVGAALNAAKS